MSRKPRGTSFHNGPPSADFETGNSEAARAEFARRLQNMMSDAGLNQSELAERATTLLGKHVGRDSVSQYIRGVTLPNATRLAAIAKVLRVAPHDLLPTRGIRSVPSATASMKPGLEVRDDPDEAYQQVNIVGMRVKRERMKDLLAILYEND